MEKGENLVLGDVTYNPNELSYIEFGKDQYGANASRYYFKEDTLSKDKQIHDPISDFILLKEFAKLNGLYRETKKVIEW